jgi:pyruvate kinase
MIYHTRPTRAETSDVATAIYEGTTAIMLSGETAVGKYPELCIQTMSRIAEEAEIHINYFSKLREIDFRINKISDALAYACSNAADSLNADAIVVFTLTGRTAKLVSRFKPGIPIIAVTSHKDTYTKLSLSWGVFPVLIDEQYNSMDDFDKVAISISKKIGCKKGSKIVTTSGFPLLQETNCLKILTIE